MAWALLRKQQELQCQRMTRLGEHRGSRTKPNRGGLAARPRRSRRPLRRQGTRRGRATCLRTDSRPPQDRPFNRDNPHNRRSQDLMDDPSTRDSLHIRDNLHLRRTQYQGDTTNIRENRYIKDPPLCRPSRGPPKCRPR